MESSIAQSVHRGLENESWDPGRFGCETSDEVLWKLDALQTFITDLNWPEKVFATHLQHRLKVMANDMISSMTSRILTKLEASLKNIKITSDARIPISICVMINAIGQCQKRFFKLCAATDEMIKSGMAGLNTEEMINSLDQSLTQASGLLVEKLTKVQESILAKLSRYDEGSFTSSILSFTKPSMDTANDFVYVCVLILLSIMLTQHTVSNFF